MTDPSVLVRRIMDRRRAEDDPDRHLLGDDERDALGCVRYVRAHRRVRAAVLQADVEDALAITEALRYEVDAQQRGLLRMARVAPAKLTWQRIATALGMPSRQGPIDRLRRLEASVLGATDQEARAGRSVQRQRALWLAGPGRAELVRALVAGWVGLRDRVPAAWCEDVDELGELQDLEAMAVAVLALARELAVAGVLDEDVVALVVRVRERLGGFPGHRG